MRKTLLVVLCLVVWPLSLLAGEIATTPDNIVISSPNTDKVDKLRMTIFYDATGNHRAIVWYNVMDSTGTKIVSQQSFSIQNLPDDPATDPALCLGVNNPWPGCTGAGTGDATLDESTTDFSDLMQGIGATLKNRVEAEMWKNIKKKFATVAK